MPPLRGLDQAGPSADLQQVTDPTIPPDPQDASPALERPTVGPSGFDLEGWQVEPATDVESLRAVARSAPLAPGVYVFLDARGLAIYVGKSIELKRRLASYARPQRLADPERRPVTIGLWGWPGRTKAGPGGAVSVGWRTTDTEAAALIEEARLIRLHRPRLNVLGLDDKGYTWVGFSSEPCPRVFTARAPSGQKPALEASRPGATYIGPFTDRRALDRTLDALRRIFPYPTHTGSPRHCLDHAIGLCPLPPGKPEGPDVIATCRRNIRSLKAVLSGGGPKVARSWRTQMNQASRQGDYEAAARRRDDIRALARITGGP